MKDLLPIFNTAIESINRINIAQLSEKLTMLNCSNIKELPSWIYESMVKPQPLLPNANVERFSFNIKGSANAFVDIHEIDNNTIYVKIFFLFGKAQFLKISNYKKNINSLMYQNYGKPDTTLTRQVKEIVGRNSLAYLKDDLILVTNNLNPLFQKEFQLHIYDSGIFMYCHGLGGFIDSKSGRPLTDREFQEKMREGAELGLMPGDESQNLESDDIDIEISTNYYDNGQKKSKGSLKDGKKDGIWIEWDEDGHTFEEYNYKDGILNGLYAAFYESGKRIQAGTYKDGERDGLWTYYRLGLIFEEVIYENGEVIDVLKWENRWENMWRVVGGKINSNVVGDEN